MDADQAADQDQRARRHMERLARSRTTAERARGLLAEARMRLQTHQVQYTAPSATTAASARINRQDDSGRRRAG